MKLTRQAVLCVGRELLESLLPDWQTVAMLRYGSLTEPSLDGIDRVEALARPFHRALKLPADCQITGISQHYRFNQDQIAFRIASPDFKETLPWNILPEVEAVYNRLYHSVMEDGIPMPGTNTEASGYFLRWTGPAVAVHRTYGPDGNVIPTPTLNGLPIHKAEGHCVSMRAASYVLVSLEDVVEEVNKLVDPEGEVRVVLKKSAETHPVVAETAKALKAASAGYAPGRPCKGCGDLLVGMLAQFRYCPECSKRADLAPAVEIPLAYVVGEANKAVGQERSLEALPANAEAVILNDPLVMLYRCWSCGVLTSRLLPTEETTAECLDCAKKPLF